MIVPTFLDWVTKKVVTDFRWAFTPAERTCSRNSIAGRRSRISGFVMKPRLRGALRRRSMSSGNACAPCGTTMLACFGVSRAGGQSGYAEGYGAEAEKRIPSSSINRHSMLLWDTRELANSRIPRDNSVSVSSRGRSNAEGAGDQRNVAIEPIRNADWNCDMHSNYSQPAETPSCGSAFPARQG